MEEKMVEVIVFNSGAPLKFQIGDAKYQIKDGPNVMKESLYLAAKAWSGEKKIRLKADFDNAQPKAPVAEAPAVEEKPAEVAAPVETVVEEKPVEAPTVEEKPKTAAPKKKSKK